MGALRPRRRLLRRRSPRPPRSSESRSRSRSRSRLRSRDGVAGADHLAAAGAGAAGGVRLRGGKRWPVRRATWRERASAQRARAPSPRRALRTPQAAEPGGKPRRPARRRPVRPARTRVLERKRRPGTLILWKGILGKGVLEKGVLGAGRLGEGAGSPAPVSVVMSGSPLESPTRAWWGPGRDALFKGQVVGVDATGVAAGGTGGRSPGIAIVIAAAAAVRETGCPGRPPQS